jgi:hypothetical protein
MSLDRPPDLPTRPAWIPLPALAPLQAQRPTAHASALSLADRPLRASHSRLPTPVLTGSGSTGLSQPFADAKGTPDEYSDHMSGSLDGTVPESGGAGTLDISAGRSEHLFRTL